MKKTYDEAVRLIEVNQYSVAGLVELIKSVSGDLEVIPEGTVTHLLYSGSIVAGDDRFRSSEVARFLQRQGAGARQVGDSHVGKLLNSVLFKEKLNLAIRGEYPDLPQDALNEKFNNIYYGTTRQNGQIRRLDNALSINNGSPLCGTLPATPTSARLRGISASLPWRSMSIRCWRKVKSRRFSAARIRMPHWRA